MSEIIETIRSFILLNFLPGEALENLRDDTPLQTSGILDSLATLVLVSFVERRFGVELDIYERGTERFHRIDDIAVLVAGKQTFCTSHDN